METKSQTRHRANEAERLALKSLEYAKKLARAIKVEKDTRYRADDLIEFRHAMYRYRMALKLARSIRERL